MGVQVSAGRHGWPEKASPGKGGWVLSRQCARPQTMAQVQATRRVQPRWAVSDLVGASTPILSWRLVDKDGGARSTALSPLFLSLGSHTHTHTHTHAHTHTHTSAVWHFLASRGAQKASSWMSFIRIPKALPAPKPPEYISLCGHKQMTGHCYLLVSSKKPFFGKDLIEPIKFKVSNVG